MADYYTEQMELAKKRIDPTGQGMANENMLGKGLVQPFANVNSGPRKIMHGVHRDHIFPLINGEKANIETGYEIRFGDLSSSVLKADSDYVVVGKISKYSFSPDHHYYLIVRDLKANKADIVERIVYEPVTEEYGYLYNNQYMDSLNVGDVIPENTIIKKSLAFDEHNNRKDGLNQMVLYMSLSQNTEDSIIIADDAAARFTSPLIKRIEITINENNIPVNLYGNDNNYKCIPDIGESIKNSVLIALRKRKKEEMVFSESVERLRRTMPSDEKKLLTGRVVDIDIYCNNPDNLNTYHNGQLKMYYNELMRMSTEVVTCVTPLKAQGVELSYELEELFGISKRTLNHDNYFDKTTFSNIKLKVAVLEDKPLKEGDKMSNRYGGKGVVSRIVPRAEMPLFGEDKEPVDIIFNSYTMNNRENPGQLFELAINHISRTICKYIAKKNLSMDEGYSLIFKFLDIVVPEQSEFYKNTVGSMTPQGKALFLNNIVSSGVIDISSKPISDSFDIDRLDLLYKTFPFVQHEVLWVPLKDSNGNIRFVPARRKVIAGNEYIFRLKQFAEEKFSANSLSATNMAGFNSKSKASKNFLELYSNTPIRFGNMEINNLNHLGPEAVIENLMIHSMSPRARRLVKEMYTCDPYNINITLDDESTNRGAEIINTRLKQIGRRLVFKKIPKKRVKLVIRPFKTTKPNLIRPVYIDKDIDNLEEFYRKKDEFNEKVKNDPDVIHPLMFEPIDVHKSIERYNENKKIYEDMKKTPRERAEEYIKREKEEEE